ncbi:MAG: hypothetical protein AAF558_02250 [Verrucomicrobiota bacterium]
MTTWILDGFMGNSSRFETLRQKLETSVGPAKIWKYDTSGLSPIDQVARFFSDVLSWESEPVNLIGYSMGGLVIRSALKWRNIPVNRVAFLNTPHHGTVMAHLAPLPATRQMRPDSRFLRSLENENWNLPTLNIWCPGDLIVVPGGRARWEKASRQEVCRMPAHVWPIYSDYWHRALIQFFTQK